MGYMEIDPETGEAVLIPDPNMDWSESQLPEGLEDLLNETNSETTTETETSPFTLTPGENPEDWSTESGDKPWLTDPEWTPEQDAPAAEGLPEWAELVEHAAEGVQQDDSEIFTAMAEDQGIN
jgi:hypothetical protein